MPTSPTANHVACRHTDAALFVTAAEAGVRVGLCERTVRRVISSGELTGYKIGKSVRVRIDEVDAWIESKAITRSTNHQLTASRAAEELAAYIKKSVDAAPPFTEAQRVELVALLQGGVSA